MHADFNRLDNYGLHRRVNIFLFLNHEWRDEYEGHLELWPRNMSACARRVAPLFGRFVAFSSTDFSYHGHPHPLACPHGRARRSIALYYYTNGRPSVECLRHDCQSTHSTLFQKPPAYPREQQQCQAGVIPSIGPLPAARATSEVGSAAPVPPQRSKLLLLVHSHNGLEDVRRSAAVLRHSLGRWLVTNFDVLVVESHSAVALDTVQAAAASFPHEHKESIHVPLADDWRCGHFSALELAQEHWKRYELVFLVNADVRLLPYASRALRMHVGDPKHSNAAFFVTRWRDNANAYNTDAFLFRPTAVLTVQDFFRDVCRCPLPPVAGGHRLKRDADAHAVARESRCVAEAMLYHRIHRLNEPLIAHDMGVRTAKASPIVSNHTGRLNAFSKDADHLGLWHTHNSSQVDECLLQQESQFLLQQRQSEPLQLERGQPKPLHSGAGGPRSEAPPWVDVALFSNEADLLRYRLRLHASFASHTLVVEGNVTHAGRLKPLLAESIVAPMRTEGFAKGPIEVVSVPLQFDSLALAKDPFAIEKAQRVYINKLLARRFPGHRVYFSDCDEYLDPEVAHGALLNAGSHRESCERPLLRSYYYGEHCTQKKPGGRAVMFRVDGTWFRKILRNEQQIRNTLDCSQSKTFSGWHLSYAISTEAILEKIRTISMPPSHAQQRAKLLSLPNESAIKAEVERRVRGCLDILERPESSWILAQVPHDGVLPPVPGWPRHPFAP